MGTPPIYGRPLGSRHPWRALLGGFYALPVIDAEAERQNEIELTNRAVIEVGTATLDGLRGHTVAAAILDELAFWQVDGGNPAEEVIASVRPALATLRGKGP